MDEIRKREAVFGLGWPVFRVKTSTDPREICEARNETFRYARDLNGVNLQDLLPWSDAPASSPDPSDLWLDPWGYLIPAWREPERILEVFGTGRRPLDAALDLDLRSGADWPGQIRAFVEAFGFPGSTLRSPFTEGWRCGERVSSVRTDLKELQGIWRSWHALRDVKWRDLPTEDRGPGKAFPPYVDRRAISELLLDLGGRLMKGVHPSLRVSESEEEHLRFSTGFTCETLSDALYTQLYLDITESRAYATCHGCEAFFARTHGNQAYCSPDCANAHRQRKWRERQKAKDG